MLREAHHQRAAGEPRFVEPPLALGLTLVATLFTFIGGTLGGSLAYHYGFNVETAGDHPVWHQSETGVFPGGH